MSVPTFALEVWMQEWEITPLRHNLSGSTGPPWAVADVLALEGLEPSDLGDDVLSYAPVVGADEMREAVAAHTGTDVEHVMITSGAAEGLAILVAAGATTDGNVVFPDPGYPPFAALPEVFLQESRPYTLRRDEGFRLDPQRVIDLIDDRTGLVIVNTPNNPTGAVVAVDDMRAIQAAAERHGARVVIDQVQHPISNAVTSTSGADVDGVAIAGDMSKAMSMPGLRLGWLVDPDPELRQRYFDLRGFFTISSAPVNERLAAIALRHRDTVLDRAQKVGTQNLAVLREFFARHADRFDWVEPEGGLIAFPWMRDEQSARPMCVALAEAGILLSPGDCFGHPDHFRLAFGSAEPETFAAAIAAIDEVVKSHEVSA